MHRVFVRGPFYFVPFQYPIVLILCPTSYKARFLAQRPCLPFQQPFLFNFFYSIIQHLFPGKKAACNLTLGNSDFWIFNRVLWITLPNSTSPNPFVSLLAPITVYIKSSNVLLVINQLCSSSFIFIGITLFVMDIFGFLATSCGSHHQIQLPPKPICVVGSYRNRLNCKLKCSAVNQLTVQPIINFLEAKFIFLWKVYGFWPGALDCGTPICQIIGYNSRLNCNR